MARRLRVLNTARDKVSLGPNNIPPASKGATPIAVDFDNGVVRKDWAKVGHRLAIVGNDNALRVAQVALGTGTAAGGVFAWQNPEGKRIHVLRVDLDVITGSTGASTLAVGTTVTSAATSSNNLLDAVAGNTAGLKSSTDDTDNGVAGVAKGQVLPAGKWVTGSQASGAVAGIVGTAIITYSVAEV